jgi:hypothetical protein
MSRRTARTPEKAFDDFLAALAQGATVAEACKTAGLGRRTAYDQRQRDEAFALRWADAIEEGTEALESEARRRAMEGSDTLMIFLLKARRPEVYRERMSVESRVEHGFKPLTAPELQRLRELGQDPANDEAFERAAAILGDMHQGDDR